MMPEDIKSAIITAKGVIIKCKLEKVSFDICCQWVESSRSVKLTALISNSPIKLTALLFIRDVNLTGLFL